MLPYHLFTCPGSGEWWGWVIFLLLVFLALKKCYSFCIFALTILPWPKRWCVSWKIQIRDLKWIKCFMSELNIKSRNCQNAERLENLKLANIILFWSTKLFQNGTLTFYYCHLYNINNYVKLYLFSFFLFFVMFWEFSPVIVSLYPQLPWFSVHACHFIYVVPIWFLTCLTGFFFKSNLSAGLLHVYSCSWHNESIRESLNFILLL